MLEVTLLRSYGSSGELPWRRSTVLSRGNRKNGDVEYKLPGELSRLNRLDEGSATVVIGFARDLGAVGCENVLTALPDLFRPFYARGQRMGELTSQETRRIY